MDLAPLIKDLRGKSNTRLPHAFLLTSSERLNRLCRTSRDLTPPDQFPLSRADVDTYRRVIKTMRLPLILSKKRFRYSGLLGKIIRVGLCVRRGIAERLVTPAMGNGWYARLCRPSRTEAARGSCIRNSLAADGPFIPFDVRLAAALTESSIQSRLTSILT